MYKWFVLLSMGGLVAANAVRFAYLPPPPPSPLTALNASEDSLANRFAAFDQRDSEVSDIRFESEDGSVSLWQRHVDRIIARGVTSLALQLDSVIVPEQARSAVAAHENIIFSPLSVAAALALVLLGASGQTFLEVARVMGLATGVHLADKSNVVHEQFGRQLAAIRERPGVDMPTQAVSAGAVFVQEGYPIRERFRRLSQVAYGSDVLSLDFSGHGEEARVAINDWAENHTYGHIKDFLAEEPQAETRVLIASALYFNGEWEYPFPKEMTSRRPFYVDENEVLEVTMMGNSAELPYAASTKLGCRMLELPYKGGDASMFVVLPDQPGAQALRELQSRLTVPALEELIASTKPEPIIVLMPRMKLEASVSLKEALQALGVHSLFDPRLADLSLISSGEQVNEVNATTTDHMVFPEQRDTNPGLYAGDVLHKVQIEVTETGTVAAAVTLVSITRDGSRRNFRVDRPFLFFIRHRTTGLVLFWGSVVRPTPSSRRAPTKKV